MRKKIPALFPRDPGGWSQVTRGVQPNAFIVEEGIVWRHPASRVAKRKQDAAALMGLS